MKKRARRGYTLVELLVSILILLLVSMAVTAGIGAASRVYRTSVFASESELLSDSVELALSDVLRYSKVVDANASPVTFTNINYEVAGGHLFLRDGYLQLSRRGDTGNAVDLLTEGTYATMELSAFEMTYDEDKKTYTGAYTIQSTAETTMTKECSFCFRSLG